jgi:hypothetical protein
MELAYDGGGLGKGAAVTTPWPAIEDVTVDAASLRGSVAASSRR